MSSKSISSNYYMKRKHSPTNTYIFQQADYYPYQCGLREFTNKSLDPLHYIIL